MNEEPPYNIKETLKYYVVFESRRSGARLSGVFTPESPSNFSLQETDQAFKDFIDFFENDQDLVLITSKRSFTQEQRVNPTMR